MFYCNPQHLEASGCARIPAFIKEVFSPWSCLEKLENMTWVYCEDTHTQKVKSHTKKPTKNHAHTERKCVHRNENKGDINFKVKGNLQIQIFWIDHIGVWNQAYRIWIYSSTQQQSMQQGETSLFSTFTEGRRAEGKGISLNCIRQVRYKEKHLVTTGKVK